MFNLKFTLNGEAVEVMVSHGAMLVDILRDQLNLTGTKKGCGKGECGACTVIMNGIAVNSCMIPAMKAFGAMIETIEGIAPKDGLHPLQESFINEGAVQCGFCTPGMIMSAKALLDHNPNPTSNEIKEAIGGNICRCTGFVKIEKAIQKAAQKIDQVKDKEGKCQERRDSCANL
jgi:carbon-monoxide dehydrogenase small subunit